MCCIHQEVIVSPERPVEIITPHISTLMQARTLDQSGQCILPSTLADRLTSCTIPEMIYHAVKRYGSHIALGMQKGRKWSTVTYDEMGHRIQSVMFGLKKLGIQSQDRVALFSKNRPNWVISDIAIQAAGAITVPVYHTYTTRQVEQILRDCGATAIFFGGKDTWAVLKPLMGKLPGLKLVMALDKEPPESMTPPLYTFPDLLRLGEMSADYKGYLKEIKTFSPHDTATIIYTSGTTGRPKGAMLSHANILSNLSALSYEFPAVEGDVTLSGLPLSHVTERTSTYMYLYMGIQVLQSRGVDFLAKELLDSRPHYVVQAPRFFEKVYERIIREIRIDRKSVV